MKKSHVVIHCSATADTGTFSWSAIREFHVEERGWTDIGYHLGIEYFGDHYEVMAGRPIDKDGAHCRHADMNRHALGVCFVGNYDAEPPPLEMLQTMARHLRPLMEALGIPADGDHVHAHRDFNPGKTCPGLAFPITDFLSMLR
jgi:hypothetical protein